MSYDVGDGLTEPRKFHYFPEDWQLSLERSGIHSIVAAFRGDATDGMRDSYGARQLIVPLLEEMFPDIEKYIFWQKKGPEVRAEKQMSKLVGKTQGSIILLIEATTRMMPRTVIDGMIGIGREFDQAGELHRIIPFVIHDPRYAHTRDRMGVKSRWGKRVFESELSDTRALAFEGAHDFLDQRLVALLREIIETSS